MVKIYAGKNLRIRTTRVLTGVPPGKTTVKLFISRGRIPIPFPKVTVLKGTGYKTVGGGSGIRGEYILLKR